MTGKTVPGPLRMLSRGWRRWRRHSHRREPGRRCDRRRRGDRCAGRDGDADKTEGRRGFFSGGKRIGDDLQVNDIPPENLERNDKTR